MFYNDVAYQCEARAAAPWGLSLKVDHVIILTPVRVLRNPSFFFRPALLVDRYALNEALNAGQSTEETLHGFRERFGGEDRMCILRPSYGHLSMVSEVQISGYYRLLKCRMMNTRTVQSEYPLLLNFPGFLFEGLTSFWGVLSRFYTSFEWQSSNHISNFTTFSFLVYALHRLKTLLDPTLMISEKLWSSMLDIGLCR